MCVCAVLQSESNDVSLSGEYSDYDEYDDSDDEGYDEYDDDTDADEEYDDDYDSLDRGSGSGGIDVMLLYCM